MTYSRKFNRQALKIKSLTDRIHGCELSIIKEFRKSSSLIKYKNIEIVAKRIIRARTSSSAVILMMGAHVIRSGVQKYLIDLMQRGYISCLAMNGAGIIHDFEFAKVGATTEEVAYYLAQGQFGLWKETGILNDVINNAYPQNNSIGMGEAVGKYIAQGGFPYKDISLLAAGYELRTPITVHVGVGYDIIHELPNCNGAATGALSYNDFLKFVYVVQQLEGGVVMNFGSAVMAPEIFLKALSMARNVAHQKGNTINHFTTLVCDLYDLPENIQKEPTRDDPSYYFRPWKTMLSRTVSQGGESFYVKGSHADTIPALWIAINEQEENVE